MTTTLEVVQQVYEAFGRGDVTAVVNLVASEVDWEGIVPATLPYAGRRRNPRRWPTFLRRSLASTALRILIFLNFRCQLECRGSPLPPSRIA